MTMLPESPEDIFKSAYANVGLFSDTVWLVGEPDDYRKANQELWVQYHRINSLYGGEEKNDTNSFPTTREQVRTVRDTIPSSRLAQYGNYQYDEDRERLYAPIYTTTQRSEQCENVFETSESCDEIWMSAEVEEQFKRLTCTENSGDKLWTQQPTPFTPSRLDPLADNEEQIPQQLLKFETWSSFLLDNYPKLAESICNPQAQSLFSDDISAPYHTEPFDLSQYPAPRYSISSPEELKLNMQINSQEIKSLWNQTTPTPFQEYQSYQRKPTHRHIENPFDPSQILAHRPPPPPPTLNADVPEFFPKLNLHDTPMLEDENGRKFFPSAHEINDQNELFPYVHVLDKLSIEGENANDFTRMPYTSTTFATTETTGLQPSSKRPYPAFYPTSVSANTGRASQQRFSSNVQNQQVSTSVYNNSHITDETPLIFSNRSISAPRNIPVYQRPPEFYIQHQDAVANNRRQGGGVDYSNLILLTRGGKTHHRGQNVKQQHQKVNINQMQADTTVPTSADHQPSGFLLGTDLFSDQPFRSPTKEDMNNYTQQETASPTKGHDSLTEENFMNDNLRMDEAPTYTTSVRLWLDQNYKEREDELQDLDRLIEEFLSIETELQQQINDEKEESEPRTKTDTKDEGFLLMEADHFPPIVPRTLTDASSSTPTDASSIIPSTASNQDSTLSHDSAFARSSNTSGASAKRRLYRDVLANMASVPVITPPATPVPENYVDPRFEELEREALEQYRPSDENLGQSFQQQGASDESISQRFQELERQALEQYHSSSSSIEGFLAETLGNSVGSAENSQISQQSFSLDLEHSTPKKKDLLGPNLTQALSSSKMDSLSPSLNQKITTSNPEWSRGCSIGIGSNDTTKRGITSSQSHHEFPGSSGVGASTPGGVSLAMNFTSNDTTIRNRPAAASKSLPAIGLTSSPTITASKHVTVPLGADGDKGGDGMSQVTPMNRRRLVLIKPAKKRHSLPSQLESVESGMGEVGPKLLVVARGVRGLGQNMGSTKAPRHLVTAIYDTPSPGVRTTGSNLPGADGARKSKSQIQQPPPQQQQQQQQHHQQNQSTLRNLGGGGDENPCSQQRHQDNPNPNVQGTQVSVKLHPVLTNNNEGDFQCMVNSSEVIINSVDCPKFPETWVQQQNNNCSQNSETLHPTTATDLEHSSPTKPPPWMRKQRKKRPTPGNKKKRNKSSGKRGHCFRKRLKGTSSACDLNTDGEILENVLNASKSETNCIIISENITNYSQNIHDKDNFSQNEESENDRDKENGSDINSSTKVIKSTKQVKTKFKECKTASIQKSTNKPCLITQKKVLNNNSSIKTCEKECHSNLKHQNATEYSYITKAIAKKLQMQKYTTTFSNNEILRNFSMIDVLQNDLHSKESSFNSMNFISVIPHDFQIETCPQKYLSDYISDSLLESAFIINKNIQFTRHKSIRKTIYVQKIWNTKYDNNKKSINIYKYNSDRINEESKLKMTQTIIAIQLTEMYKNCPHDSLQISFSNQYSGKLNSFFSLSLKDEMDSKSLFIVQRIKYTIYENLAVMKNVHILRLDHDILLVCNEINGSMNSMDKDCNLKSNNFFEKMNYVKLNFILVSTTHITSEKDIVRETSDIISLSRNIKAVNKNTPNIFPCQKLAQLCVSNQTNEESLQRMEQNSLQCKNKHEKNNILKNSLSNSKFEMSRHIISESMEECEEVEPEALSPFTRTNSTDLCNAGQQDICEMFPISKERISVSSKLTKSTKSLQKHEAESEKNASSVLSNDKVKDPPMILKLRQQVLQTATTIQLACGKQKAILPTVEPDLSHIRKKKTETTCCIQ